MALRKIHHEGTKPRSLGKAAAIFARWVGMWGTSRGFVPSWRILQNSGYRPRHAFRRVRASGGDVHPDFAKLAAP
jgi:hypothetical protein